MLVGLAAAVLLISLAIPARTAGPPSSGRSGSGGAQAAPPAPKVSDVKLLGQRIMVGFPGTVADRQLLRRIREGRVGSVILFAENIVSSAQVRSLTGSLQRAARAGHNPPLLIAIDQEGGQVKRFRTGPPFLSPPQMASGHSPAEATRQGRLTGAYLKGRGVNMELAPVLDVPTSPHAFIWRQGRAFSLRSSAVARYGTQFALGIQSAGIAATGKHFPGVGSAGVDTDNKLDELHPSSAQREAALVPYQTLIGRGLDTIMVSTAGFPAYDASAVPAAFSRRIIVGLLRRQLGFAGVTITDSISSTTPTGHNEVTAGVLAARAGADILLYTDAAAGELPALQSDMVSG